MDKGVVQDNKEVNKGVVQDNKEVDEVGILDKVGNEVDNLDKDKEDRYNRKGIFFS